MKGTHKIAGGLVAPRQTAVSPDPVPSGDYRLAEVQPAGVGAEVLGSLDGSIVGNDVMQPTLACDNASDYYFAELGGQLSSGDTAAIGFWQPVL